MERIVKMNGEELLEAFKIANPNLMKLDPTIDIYKVEEYASSETNGEVIKYNPPLIKIDVWHPFIFDNRLIPDEFYGIEVKNITYDKDYPSEFDVSDDAVILITDYYHPEKYIKFVDRELNTIAKKLKRKNLTKKEALDAITGGFDEHLKWYNENKPKNGT